MARGCAALRSAFLLLGLSGRADLDLPRRFSRAHTWLPGTAHEGPPSASKGWTDQTSLGGITSTSPRWIDQASSSVGPIRPPTGL
ncbi:hypothetical protein EV715DRAFT_255709, partial [Schizophyllum commune]